MSTAKITRTASKRYALVNRLVEEAESCGDRARAALLLGMAREEADNAAKSLRQHLTRKRPAHELYRRKVA